LDFGRKVVLKEFENCVPVFGKNLPGRFQVRQTCLSDFLLHTRTLTLVETNQKNHHTFEITEIHIHAKNNFRNQFWMALGHLI
jgi:hypothetical protein